MNETLLEQLSDYTLLCVEDEDGIRKRLVNTLKYYFKDVLEASNGEEGYDLYCEYKPDVILSDIEMPHKNGVEMVQKIRAKDLNTIVIMVTAYSNEEYLLDLINLHINHYILKPVNSDNLLSGIVEGFGARLKENLTFSEELIYDVQMQELLYKEEVIALRKREKLFLQLLFEHKDAVVTYEMIEDSLWREKTMSMSALKTFIKELRQKLPIELIENVHQTGYRLQILS